MITSAAGSVRRKDVNMKNNGSINISGNGSINIIITEKTTLKELLEILEASGCVEKAETTPTPRALRERKHEDGTVEQVAPITQTSDGSCLVYSSGYAVYDNGTGQTVVWLPECRSFTYCFDKLKDNEKKLAPQRSTVGEDVLDGQPWFMAVMLCGDHKVEHNSMNRQCSRKGSKKELNDGDETEEKQEKRWNGAYHYESPEQAYIRKETIREQLSKLTPRQREVFLLYHKYGYKQQEIADMLGIRQQSLNETLKDAETKIRNIRGLFR